MLSKSVELYKFDDQQLFLEIDPKQRVRRYFFKDGKSKDQIGKDHPLNFPLKDNEIGSEMGAVFRQLIKREFEVPPKKQNEVVKKVQCELRTIQEAQTKAIEEALEREKDKDKLDITVLKEEETNILVFNVAKYIANYTTFITFRDNEDCYYYDEGIYKPNAKSIIKEKAQEILGNLSTTYIFNEIIRTIKVDSYIDREEANTDLNLLCLENGILNIETEELTPHSPDMIFFNKLPVRYVPGQDCPKIKKFLEEVLHKEDIPVMEEAIGYCLYRKHIFHKAYMFFGSGRNGKGALLRLLRAFLGKQNCTSVPLQNIGNDKYATVKLHKKMANVCGDLGQKPFKNTDNFKMATGEDPLHAQEKYEKAFDFVSYAKQFYSANKPPDVNDDTIAFWDRWIYFIFPNVFLGKNADKQLDEKLQNPEELSGLLNLALKALKRLLKQNDFSYSKSTKEISNLWLREANPIKAFIDDRLEFDEQNTLSKDEVYGPYVDYCILHDEVPKSKEKFGKELKRLLGTKIESTRLRIGDKRKYGWKGIKLKPEDDEEKDEEIEEKQKKLIDKQEHISKHIIKREGTLIEAIDSQFTKIYTKKEELTGLPKEILDFIGREGSLKDQLIIHLKKRGYNPNVIERIIKTMIEQEIIRYDDKRQYLEVM